jgi:hypothetical protein
LNISKASLRFQVCSGGSLALMPRIAPSAWWSSSVAVVIQPSRVTVWWLEKSSGSRVTATMSS